ncbi:hypothetical protein Tco_0715777 [Tanacetum coccineum]
MFTILGFYPSTGYHNAEYDNEELTINPTQVFSVHNWALKPNQTEGPPFIDHMKAICNLDVHVDSKAPKPFSQTEEVPQGKKHRAKSGIRRKQSLKHTSESQTEASKSKTGQLKKETQSSLAKGKSPSHPSPSTLVVSEMHKEAHQAADGPTSLGATSKERSHPQLSSGMSAFILIEPILFSFFHLHFESTLGHDVSADSTAKADPGLSAPKDSIPLQQDQTKSTRDGLETAHTDSGINEESRANEISKKIKMEDLSDLLKDTISAFFTPDSPQDEPIIISDKSEKEEEVAKDKESHASSHDSEHFKLLASHNFATCLPTKLKELPLKFTELFGEIKELKQHVKDMKIELPGDLKEIPTKLETFTSTISSLTSQVAELKNIQWELPAELQALPVLFATMVENASGATTKDVPSAGQATASPAEGEKNTKDAETNLQNEPVDLLGIDVVEQYHNKKLLFDKYCDKMLKRRKSSKIINCDVITQKGPISLKVYREDGIIKIIANFKVSDFHLAE